ncbi:MAG: pyridoxal-phosphate dependent enzyme [Robiginitomaculum sp.]
MKIDVPNLSIIRNVRKKLSPYVIETPTCHLESDTVSSIIDSKIFAKLELFQKTGTFKARAAINNVLAIETMPARITSVSAGNHAVAVAYAAKKLGADAKLVMFASANPFRIALTKSFGAEVIIAKNSKRAFELVSAIEKDEDRIFIHPFEGKRVTEATAGVGLELIQSVPDLDAVIVSVGGGGLASGVACAVKQLSPKCAVYGVEPEGAAVMSLSFKLGRETTLNEVNTIADSLAPPMTTPYAYAICRQYLDKLVTVTDAQIAAAAMITFSDYKLAVEPAGATALAGLLGPLKRKLRGKKVGLVICGTNIDSHAFMDLINTGQQELSKGIFDSNIIQ